MDRLAETDAEKMCLQKMLKSGKLRLHFVMAWYICTVIMQSHGDSAY